jgi:arylsulfatase A-like enzyme
MTRFFMTRRFTVGISVVLACVVWFGSGNLAAKTSLPHLVLVVTDDQRPDTMGAMGHREIKTPHLDRLVASGMTFHRAYTGYPICYASRAQLLTGCNAFTALENYPRSQIRPSLATLSRTLGNAGYHTVYSGKWHNDGNPVTRGYHRTAALYSAGGAKQVTMPERDSRGMPLTGYRGWTFKSADQQPRLDLGVGLQPDNSRVIGDAVVEVIHNSPSEQPLFLHVNFAFPHDPRMWPQGMEAAYDAAEISLPANFRPDHGFDHGNQGGRDEVLLPRPLDPLQVQQELAIYYAMISDVDRQVGRILAAFEQTGRLSNTLFVFTSDQGLALGSHGLLGKQNQYEHSIRSPLVIAGPRGLCHSADRFGSTQTTRFVDPEKDSRIAEVLVDTTSDALVQLSDLFPTLCDVARVPIPQSVQGKSLVPILSGEVSNVHEFVYGVFTDTQRMITSKRWKYIEYPQVGIRQLFDLQNDPDELVNQAESLQHQELVQQLQKNLRDWQVRHHDPALNVIGNR